MGLQVTDWLVAQGAKNIVLFSRRAPSEEVSNRLADWQAGGIDVQAISLDISDRTAVEETLQSLRSRLPAIRGSNRR